ncbi:1-deoxy-D-xylulose-5-phosphate synthase [Scrofimicrobium sp. R131]|uniref:1-deoxy-D-xylulose-5-phosphate synthase n=1 Tax=Scrofimicrobium appendicitidis TaxID=3079930 RepID=A0AAU7V7B5_9ACTO
MRSLLDRIQTPRDLDSLTAAELVSLAEQIRAYLIESVAKTGGHLGPNLGVVELTLALHRVFDSPRDTIIWDTGHQAYVHKLLTGRKDFTQLRQPGGLSGYPSRAESAHDVVENSHASTAISWADGVSRERRRRGQAGSVVAVIGDGALTGGMAWEALNDMAEDQDRSLVVVVNDNGRSYEPTVGGMARHLAGLRTSEHYERSLAWGKRKLLSLGEPGRAAFEALHGLKAGIKDVLAPQVLFEELGLKYLGPIDGHDLIAVEYNLELAKSFGGPVIVHVITEKGRGYVPAEEDVSDRFHAVGKIHPETGLPVAPQRFGWTAVFAQEIVELAERNPDVVGITAAMKAPVGLQPLANRFPDRVVDVGIAEQHALTSAAGMAFAGAHPVVALYATFLNRAFDQLLMDVALHRAPVTVVLDRAGITGDDGPSHNGMWDLSLAAMVPGLRVAVPRDGATLRAELDEAVGDSSGPTLLRYPKGALPPDLAVAETSAAGDYLYRGREADVLLVALGPLAHYAVEAAQELKSRGIEADVLDPRWVLPVAPELVEVANSYRVVVSAEDGLEVGGVGSELARQTQVPVLVRGVPREFQAQGKREEILARLGLDSAGLVEAVESALLRSSISRNI